MTSRIDNLKLYIKQLNDAGVRKTYFYELVGKSLKNTLGEPSPIRRAKAFSYLIDNVELVVNPYELVAGSILGLCPIAKQLPNYETREKEAVAVLEEYCKQKEASGREFDKTTRFALISRDHYEANISYDELQRLISKMQDVFKKKNISYHEIARQLERYFEFDYGDETMELFHDLPFEVANHLSLNYERLINKGLGKIHQEIKQGLTSANNNETRLFFESTDIVISATIQFIIRYADKLFSESENEEDALRSKELKEMAKICKKISYHSPDSFREAIQLMWLIHIIANIGGGSALSFGRFDQYMFPFYSHDVNKGIINKDQAREIISSIWLKVNEPKMRTVQSMCLAGITPYGKDGTNELTRLCLEVCGELRMPFPNVSVRFNNESPEWLYDIVIDTIKKGFGQPMVLNDESWIPNLTGLGYELEDARNYYNMGCVEIMLQGMQPTWRSLTAINFAGIFELVFNNGKENRAGLAGVKIGGIENLNSFDEFFNAYITQLKHAITVSMNGVYNEIDRMKNYYDPFASVFIDDCLEMGRDMFHGGCRYYNPWAIGGHGLGTAADSLSAIKKYVYDEKVYSLNYIKEALQHNFEGYEELRQQLNKGANCYGNDIEEVDSIARRIYDVYTDTVNSFNDGKVNGKFITSIFSYTSQVFRAERVSATPNGRKTGEMISDNAGPSQGKDQGGPTKLLNSVLKLDYTKLTGAYALNLKMSPSVLSSSRGLKAFKSLVKTYLVRGGLQIQVNVIDHKLLKEAQKNPKEHQNVIVRVAGFCEHFINLDKKIQNEIISRTEYDL